MDVDPRPGATVSECFVNVDRHVASAGGSRRLGWTIWIIPGVMIEAEFHAVWEGPGGGLTDVTPHRAGERRVLFLPAPGAQYHGTAPDNARHPVVDHPLVREFIRRGEARYELLKDAEPGTAVSVPFDVYESLFPNEPVIIDAFQAFATSRRGRNDPCHCGSGQKRKRCCG